VAENAARKHISSKIPLRKLTALDIIVEVEGEKPVTVNIDIQLSIPLGITNQNAQQLANEAAKKAQQAAQAYLKEIACKSNK